MTYSSFHIYTESPIGIVILKVQTQCIFYVHFPDVFACSNVPNLKGHSIIRESEELLSFLLQSDVVVSLQESHEGNIAKVEVREDRHVKEILLHCDPTFLLDSEHGWVN